MALLIEGRQRLDKQRQERMGWLQWMVWQSQSSEELKLEEFLPGKPKEISAKKNPEAFAAELEKMVARAKRREKRKREKPPLKPEEGLNGARTQS